MLLKMTKEHIANIKYVADMLRLMGNKKTFLILQIICDSKGIYVTELSIKANLFQTEVSSILSKLRRYGIVKCTHESKLRKYEINHRRFEHIAVTIKNYVNTIS